jgi:hypothetical protein
VKLREVMISGSNKWMTCAIFIIKQILFSVYVSLSNEKSSCSYPKEFQIHSNCRVGLSSGQRVFFSTEILTPKKGESSVMNSKQLDQLWQ